MLSNEFKSFKRIKNVTRDIGLCDMKVFEDLNIIENALYEKNFYEYVINRICRYLDLDMKSHRNMIETENEILNTIAKYEHNLKALEIIKEKRVNVDWLIEVDFDLERYNRHIAPFHRYDLNAMEIKILKEVLL